MPSYQGLYFRGGGPDERGPKSGQGPSRKETQKQKISTKSGETGPAYPHFMGGIAPGGGGGTPPPSRGGPPDDGGMMNQMRRKMRRMILMKKLYQ